MTEDFASLKMLGHVYIVSDATELPKKRLHLTKSDCLLFSPQVEDAKDLAQIVRDVTRYGGTYRPEE